MQVKRGTAIKIVTQRCDSLSLAEYYSTINTFVAHIVKWHNAFLKASLILQDYKGIRKAHLVVRSILDAGTLPLCRGVWPPQKLQCLLSFPPFTLREQEPGRLRHETHEHHHQGGRDGAADR